MFEREIKFIYDFNLNKINRLGPYFTFEQLLSSDIHPAILQYISAEIDYLIFEDRQKLLKNSVFDYSGEKISYHFNQISDEVKKTKRFALEYIAKLVMHASSFTVNYLIHPKWTLTKFVFDEEKHKSTNEIKQILNYVHYYKYISKILVTYINAKKILSMNAQEFEDLIEKADRLGVESNLQEILSNSLRSMAEFFNIGELKKTKVPLIAVELFLEEKGLIRHLKKITEVFGADENAKFNTVDYDKVLGSVMQEVREAEPEAVEQEEYEQEEIKDVVIPEDKQEQEFTEDGEAIEEEYVNIEYNKKEEPKETDIQELNEESEPEFEEINPELMRKKEQEAEVEREEEQKQEQELEKERGQEENEKEQIIFDDADLVIPQSKKIKIRFDDDIHLEPVIENGRQTDEELNPAEETEKEPELNFAKKEEEPAGEEITIEGLRNTFDEDEAEIEFQKELERAQRDLDNGVDEKELPGQEPAKLKDSEQEEEESLSFMIKHKNDEPVREEEKVHEEEREQEKEQVPEVVEFNNMKNNPGKNSKLTSDDNNIEPREMELAEILERKEMTFIIDVIFDYDIESFASLLDEISHCQNVNEAYQKINQALTGRNIDLESNEAESFRSIISEFFRQK